MNRQRGITLIELLAALLISGFVILMASRIFISGNRQFLLRSAESRRLEELYRLKAVVQGILKREVVQCAAGRLALREGDGSLDAETYIKDHFPHFTGATFRCLETVSVQGALVEWKDWFQPRLIEYRVVLKSNGGENTLTGSSIK
jgi:prepilin-type N-terminal cleavage/methylation domain-containing protein